MCFIHFKLSRLCFALRKYIVDYRDFFNRDKYQFLINIYSQSLYTAINFLSNKALNISNLLFIEKDFNIRDIR